MSRIAFIFPGQGAQVCGMGQDFYEQTETGKKIFDKASELLGFSMPELCFEKNDRLDITEYTQAAMVTAGIAMMRVLEERGIKPDMAAGLSLGEYCALAAAGVMSDEDAIRTVRQRGILMQEAVPVGVGGMAAIIGLGNEALKEACQEAAQNEVVEPANFNSPTQIVIAGHKTALARACEAAKAKGAKRALMLPVSAPFHSSLLKPASDRLAEYMAGLTFSAPQIPLINNVDVAILNEPQAIKDALVRQAASPVRWVETIEKMAGMGITHIVECGPGKVLAGLCKRINSSLTGDAIVDQASLDKVLEALK